MQHSSSFFWSSWQESNSDHKQHNSTLRRSNAKRKDLLVCKNLNSNLYCSSLEETQDLYRRCSCREWGNAAWLMDGWMISKLTSSLGSGLQFLQWHSSEWILKISAWNGHIKSVFLFVSFFIAEARQILWLPLATLAFSRSDTVSWNYINNAC